MRNGFGLIEMAQSSPKDNSNSLALYLRLLAYVRPYWVSFALSMVGFVMFAISQPLFPKLIEYFLRALDPKQPMITVPLLGAVEQQSLVWMVPLALVIMGVLRGIGVFVGNYYLANVALRTVHDIRTELFSHLTHLPCSYYDASHSGYVVSSVIYNVSQVTSAATDALKVIVREGLTVIALLVFLFWSNWKLSLVFMTVTPMIAAVVMVTGKRFRAISLRIQNAMGNVTHVVSEYVSGYRTVRIFGGENYEKDRFNTASWYNSKQALKLVRLSSIHTPLLQILVLIAMALLMYTLLYLKDTASIMMPTSELVAYITAAALLPKPIRQLSEVNASIQRGLAAASSIFGQMDEFSESDHGDTVIENVSGDIEFKNVGFSYDNADKKALEGISFKIQRGQTVALVGHSGSGKSTIASLLMRFYNYDQGDILLDGVSINALPLSHLRKQIALVTQDVNLFSGTIAENIAYGALRHKSRAAIEEAAKVVHAMEFINKLPRKLDTSVGDDGVLLSGGQRQRLALARAILKDAPILILDEATSALDAESERYIQDALKKIVKDRTTLIIAHRLSTIENADRILVIQEGKIVEQGSHSELIEKDGAYANLYQLQYHTKKSSMPNE